MMRSMYSGVSGLRVHQTRMDVIGNNIANVNTAGFKSERVTFSDMYYQTIQGATGPNAETESGGRNPMQIGLGANLASIDKIMTEGAAQRTDRSLDIKIEGEGFFVVGDSSGTYFTRAGVFGLDYAGNMVTPEGKLLKGWPVDQNGEIMQGQVSNLKVYSPENAYSEPQKTTHSQIYGNVDKTDSRIMDGSYTFTSTVFDELGYRYTIDYSIEPVMSGGNPVDGAYKIVLNNVKDENGNVKIDISGGGATGVGFGPDTSTTNPTTDITFDTTTGKLATGGDIYINGMNKHLSGMVDSLKLDLNQLTMYAGKANIESKRGDTEGLGAGREAGTLSGFSVAQDGKITGKYTNGDTRTLGQIVIANFSNPGGLQKVGSNLFAATPNSGDFDGIGDDPTAIGSELTSGVLEMSNVDLSKEFTDMIVTQRGYQANSKIISVSDELLQELVNLVR